MKKNYFTLAGAIIVVLTLIAFSDNLVTDVGQPSNSQPRFIIHGLICFAWVVLLFVQANLVRRDDRATHMRLGLIGIPLAIGVYVSTEYLHFSKFTTWAETAEEARANILFMNSYAVCVVLGFVHRKQPERHKRFMYLATLYMLGPVVGRVGGNIGINPFITHPVIWNAMFASFLLYDWTTDRKIHRITYLGYAWFWIVWIVAIFS